MPCAVVLPLRFLLFGDEDPFTVVLLGPALEEGLKLAALFLALLGAAMVLPRGRDPENALRYWLFLAPWFVGGGYGLLEGIFVYPGESHPDFILRGFAHAAFAAAGLAGILWAWRETERPFVGLALGFGLAWAAHIVFNSIAVVTWYSGVRFEEQALYGSSLLVLAMIALARDIGREPASPQARAVLRVPGRRVRT